MSDSEVDVSFNKLSTPQGRKRKSSQKLPIYGKVGTPLVHIDNDQEWDKWKKEQNQILNEKNGEEEEAEEESESPSISTETSDDYFDRDAYNKNIKDGKKIIKSGLDPLNEHYIDVPKNDRIAIQINNQNLSKKTCKSFQKDFEKSLKKNKKLDEKNIFSEDEIDKEFEKKWAPKRKGFVKKSKKINEQRKYRPFDDFLSEMEKEDMEHKIDAQHYYLWLKKKLDEPNVSWKNQHYMKEIQKIQPKANYKTKFRAIVKDVQKYYRNFKKDDQ